MNIIMVEYVFSSHLNLVEKRNIWLWSWRHILSLTGATSSSRGESIRPPSPQEIWWRHDVIKFPRIGWSLKMFWKCLWYRHLIWEENTKVVTSWRHQLLGKIWKDRFCTHGHDQTWYRRCLRSESLKDEYSTYRLKVAHTHATSPC